MKQSTANLKPNPSPRLNPGNRKKRIGYMTVAMSEGVEIALYHVTMLGLESAFNTVTQGRTPFRSDLVSQVVIYNQ